MYTRTEFERLVAARQRTERRDRGLLAVVSIGLGLGQLPFIQWVDRMYVHRTAVTIEGSVFLAYMALVAWLLWRMRRRGSAARLRCPDCGARLDDLSERVAAATGRCDSCGGQVVMDESG